MSKKSPTQPDLAQLRHDLATPITVLSLNVELLAKKLQNKSAAEQKYLAAMKLSVAELRALLEQF
jgi:signal transduction histidine kinase